MLIPPQTHWFANRGQIMQVAINAVALIATTKGAWPDLAANRFFATGALIFYALVASVLVSIWQLARAVRAGGIQAAPESPEIALLDASVVQLQQGPAQYPLKCRAKMRNESARCIDVQMAGFRPKHVTLKKFETSALQVKLAKDWMPPKEAIDRVAVLPNQEFQAWVGIDETKFTEDAVRRLRGEIGTLVLRINGQPYEVKL
jgi:hypothetical protein